MRAGSPEKVNAGSAASAGPEKTGTVMETMNGTANGKIDVGAFFTELAELTKPAKNPPAKEFFNGRVVTRIWAKRSHWGEIIWRVDHFRRNDSVEGGKQFQLEPSDLQDAMRGLYQAQRWIKKAERRRRGGFLSW
jgi:hypothetical protein